jgi:SAM-dependent methyltransferase
MNEAKFDGMGKIYSRYRPCYPQSFIDYLFKNINITKDSIIADIGSGTGILTRQLLEECNKVYGVEPNMDMRNIAEKELQKLPGFTSVNGSAESTNLPDSSINYITVAQAFHWFNRQRFRRECQRILKPNGKVILVWNSRDEKSELVMENDEINRKYCPDFKGFSGGTRGASSKDDFDDFFSGEYNEKVFSNDLIFDINNFIGRNLSASYALKESDENYNAYILEIKTLFEKYSKNKKVLMPNLTRCYVGQV